MGHRRPRYHPQPDLALEVLRSPQSGIVAAASDQVSVRAHLRYPALIDDNDVVSSPNP